MGDLQMLAASIQAEGLLHPVGITENYELVFGLRRLLAVRDILRHPTIETRVVCVSSIVAGEYAENEIRKDFTPSERVAIGKAIEAQIGKRQGQRTDRVHPRNCAEVQAGEETREVAARRAGFPSRDSYDRAKKVAANGAPELVQAVDRGDMAISTGALLAELPSSEQAEIVARGEKEILQKAKEIREKKAEERREKKLEIARRIADEPLALPTGPFRVVAADPPWPYDNRSEDTTHRARNPYPASTLQQIKELPVADLAHDDCILWLWTSNAFMQGAYACIEAWGFEAKTILTWVKDRMGMGDWLRGQTEHCIMAVRGKPVVTLTNQTTALRGPVREHSRKPDEFYQLVDSLCPGCKLEMFAREEREGWTTWGAEKRLFQPQKKISAPQ